MARKSCSLERGKHELTIQAWDNNGNNKAPTPGANVTVEDGDASYEAALAGKPYIARELDQSYMESCSDNL